jgi:hypothetical protein
MGDHRQPSRTGAVIVMILAVLGLFCGSFLYIDALARWWQ